ncbi:aspartate/glutamate racemase family protein [Candidatus Bipolaricaulota bacterium]|nr:aspartate/glutamate racemase family protein [Candidatus Bipolaricaulota bacterium]
MKVRVVIPNTSQAFLDSQVPERQLVAGGRFELEVICLDQGPESLESAVDEAVVGPAILAEGIRAEAEGFDAMVIDCAMDIGLAAIRERISIPVTSAAQASYLVALGLGDRFSVITMIEPATRLIDSLIRRYRLTERVASVRFADVPVLGLMDTEAAAKAIAKASRTALKTDGADVIVLGCTGMAPVARKLQEDLRVPVVDPAAAALLMAESYVRMGLLHSRRSYPHPPSKKLNGSMYDAAGLEGLGFYGSTH